MKSLSFSQPLNLAVAENASSPTGLLGSEIWSTTANKKLVWDGAMWESSMPGVGDVAGPASAVAGAAVKFSGTSGKSIATDGRPIRPELRVLTSDFATTLTNGVEAIWTVTLQPLERVAVTGILIHQSNSTTCGASLGFFNVGSQSDLGGSGFTYQNIATATAATGVSDGDAGANVYQGALASVTNANANLGSLITGTFINLHATETRVLTIFAGTIGTGVVTVKAGSMCVVRRH